MTKPKQDPPPSGLPPAGFLTAAAYLMTVVNSADAPLVRRISAAKHLLPFQQPKVARAGPPGKKAEKQDAARNAGQGSEWEALMGKPSRPKLVQ